MVMEKQPSLGRMVVVTGQSIEQLDVRTLFVFDNIVVDGLVACEHGLA